MRFGKYNAPWRRKKQPISLPRIALASLLLSAGAAAFLYSIRPAPPIMHVTGTDRLGTPGLDLADESTRVALRHLQAPIAHYRGQWLGYACIDGKADSPEVYVLSRHRMSSHGAVEAIRVTVRIDQGGDVAHESLETILRGQGTGSRTRSFDHQEASEFRRLLVEGGYLGLSNGLDRKCPMDAITLQSCVNGRYFGHASHCGEPDKSMLTQLAAAIEAFALGDQETPR